MKVAAIIRKKNNVLFKDKQGHSVFLLGVNYWPSSSALNMWTEWNPDELMDDIRQMKSLDMNCCRPFLYMPAFMDNPDAVNPVMIERLHHFMQLCEANELYAFPTFIVGHMSGEDWDVSWRQGDNFITDPRVTKITKTYIQSVVRELQSYSTVLGWLLSNELPNYIGQQSSAEVENWVRDIIAVIKKEDPNRPVSIGDGAWSPEITTKPAGFELRKLNRYQDFVGLHYYPRGMSAWHHSYTTAFRTCLAREWNRPVIIEEFGTSTTLCSEKNQAAYYRNVFYSALINGAEGTLSWCLNDFDFENKRPYSHHTFEERFGIVRTDKSLKPAAAEFKKFSELSSELVQTDYDRIDADIGLFIPSSFYYEYPYPFEPVFEDCYGLYLETFSLLKRANLNVRTIYEPAQELENRGHFCHDLILDPEKQSVLFLPRMNWVLKPTHEKLTEYIKNGGVIYFSFANDSWVLDWQKLAGVETDCKFGVPDFYQNDILEVTVNRDWGCFQKNETFQIPMDKQDPEYSYCPVLETSAKVLMRDSSGSPFLVERSLGKGTVYFCAFPLEMLALNHPNEQWKFDISRIYRSVFQYCNAEPLFDVEGDGLEMGVWQSDSIHRIIIFNHSWEKQHGKFTIASSNYSIEYSSDKLHKVETYSYEFYLKRKELMTLSIVKNV